MEQKDWYENKLIVYLLLIVVFPIGIYALWKSNSFSKNLKILLSAVVAVIVLLIGSHDNNKPNKRSSTTTISQIEENSQKVVAKPKEITFQEYFIQQKASFYNSEYINANNDASKMLFHKNTQILTKQLLNSTDQILTNWIGTISRISLAYGHNKRDMELLNTMSPNDVIAKYPEGRDINIYITIGKKKVEDAMYLAEVYQEFNPQKNERGIKLKSSLYEIVLGLKEGQKVVFSAKVIRAMDTNGKNNEQFTGLNIELTNIKPIN